MELQSDSIEEAFRRFTSPKEVDQLAKPMNEIFAYYDLAKQMEGFDELMSRDILKMARTIVLRQMEVVLSENGEWDYTQVTEYDWMFITSAMLGGAEHLFFEKCKLGIPWCLLDKKLNDCQSTIHKSELNGNMSHQCPKCGIAGIMRQNVLFCDRCRICLFQDDNKLQHCRFCRIARGSSLCGQLDQNGKCHLCSYTNMQVDKRDPLKYTVVDGEFVAVHKDLQERKVHVPKALSLEDPKHFGHLIFRYRKLVLVTHEQRTQCPQ